MKMLAVMAPLGMASLVRRPTIHANLFFVGPSNNCMKGPYHSGIHTC